MGWADIQQRRRKQRGEVGKREAKAVLVSLISHSERSGRRTTARKRGEGEEEQKPKKKRWAVLRLKNITVVLL